MLWLVTWSGSGAVWFPLAFLFIVFDRFDLKVLPQQELILPAMLGSFLSLISGQVVKRIVGRARPYTSIPELKPLIRPPKDRSFPSTHASTAVALFVGLILVGHPLAPLVGIWSLGVCFSRYYLAVHYPTDIIGGAIWGALFGCLDFSGTVNYLLAIRLF